VFVRVITRFCHFQVKEIEKRDSAWTSDGQLTRLLRPGAAYFNLNPFEVLFAVWGRPTTLLSQVLQVDPDLTLEEMKKQYKKLSLLVHPDKNPNDRDRAKTAFECEFVHAHCTDLRVHSVQESNRVTRRPRRDGSVSADDC
jgi:hypothetical protein